MRFIDGYDEFVEHEEEENAGKPVYYLYEDGLGHITCFDDHAFTYGSGPTPTFETALCGKQNILTLSSIEDRQKWCPQCTAVAVMQELAE